MLLISSIDHCEKRTSEDLKTVNTTYVICYFFHLRLWNQLPDSVVQCSSTPAHPSLNSQYASLLQEQPTHLVGKNSKSQVYASQGNNTLTFLLIQGECKQRKNVTCSYT